MNTLLRMIPAVRRLEDELRYRADSAAIHERECTEEIARLKAKLAWHSKEHDEMFKCAEEAALKQRALQRQLEARSLPWPRPAQRLQPHQVRERIGPEPAAGAMAAVHQELDDAIAELLDTVTGAPSATMSEAQRLHQAGGAEALRQLQNNLMRIHHAARHADEKESGGEE